MTVHHTIIKKAASLSVILTYDADREEVTALHTPSNQRLVVDCSGHETDNEAAKSAQVMLLDMVTFNEEARDNKTQTIKADEHGFYIEEGGDYFDLNEEGLAEIIEAITNPDRETGDEDEEAERDVSSVVPDTFKKLYKDIGINGTDNGDFLAAQMSNLTSIADGNRVRVDVEKVEALGWANGVDYPAREGNRGWQGRYRMTVANMLRKRIADAKVMQVPARCAKDGVAYSVEVPASFCDKWKTIVKISKKAQAEMDAEAAKIVSTPEVKAPKRSRKAK